MVDHRTNKISPLTIPLTASQRRRLEAAVRGLGVDLETYATKWLMAAVESIENRAARDSWPHERGAPAEGLTPKETSPGASVSAP